MFNIAIVEDDESATALLEQNLRSYGEEKGEQFNIFKFGGTVSFLANYPGNYDIVFMDIELPDLNGMTAARKLREIDKNVVLIFVTNLAQFAVRGKVVCGKSGVKLLVSVDDAMMTIMSSDIKYLEIMSHNIIFHTVHGDYRSYGTLKKIEKQLTDAHFMRCNSCYLVNLRYVTSVKGFSVYVGDNCLHISHPRKQAFLRALNNYYGGGAIDV